LDLNPLSVPNPRSVFQDRNRTERTGGCSLRMYDVFVLCVMCVQDRKGCFGTVESRREEIWVVREEIDPPMSKSVHSGQVSQVISISVVMNATYY